MKCQRCSQPAVIITANRKALCKVHFIQAFEKRVKDTIKRCKLLSVNERIAVACSGGKDSTVALYVVSRLYKDVTAIAIDEGIRGYRSKTLKDLKQFCSEHRIKLKVFSFKEEYGATLDQIVKRVRMPACRVCGILRRQVLNRHAAGFDRLVTGHNLDDEAQSILMNLLKANTELLARLGPITGIKPWKGFTPRVKPLYLCTEKEDAAYAILMGFNIGFNECPYAGSSFRSTIRQALSDLEDKHPGSKQYLVKNFLRMLPGLRKRVSMDINKEKNKEDRCIAYCKECGQPSAGRVCAACSIIINLRAKNSSGRDTALTRVFYAVHKD
ncbi:TIGR00269 family protein [Candidatus Woesearchaeota archaeon CG08_land_8_20_14_0_20_47_9]|nr:MAG: TIGR00269 family protein [Candidatus Woesearchaeota archaeon CG10_big_fil_rev_8_21_14_0_10_47_5]PIO04187.1 MAG: TIGR00269 family protein [Candidatus Woesearchaeota archaeon CG08_land_8_20_14_0_20_47_9]